MNKYSMEEIRRAQDTIDQTMREAGWDAEMEDEELDELAKTVLIIKQSIAEYLMILQEFHRGSMPREEAEHNDAERRSAHDDKAYQHGADPTGVLAGAPGWDGQ